MKKKTKPRKPRDIYEEYIHASIYKNNSRFYINTTGYLVEAKKLHKFLEQYIKWRKE